LSDIFFYVDLVFVLDIQRVLKDLQRTRLSVIIRFGSSLSTSFVSKLDWRHTGELRKRDNLLRYRGEEVGEEPIHTTARKPGPLKDQ
jgi:hypothetical protein